jgi:hypothetical protein
MKIFKSKTSDEYINKYKYIYIYMRMRGVCIWQRFETHVLNIRYFNASYNMVAINNQKENNEKRRPSSGMAIHSWRNSQTNFLFQNWNLVYAEKRIERTQAAHMPLLRLLSALAVQDRNKINKPTSGW